MQASELVYINIEKTLSLLSSVFSLQSFLLLLNIHHFLAIKQSKSLEPVTAILSTIITFYLSANYNQPSQQRNAFQSSSRHSPLNSLHMDYLWSIGRDDSGH
jgi:positive regulator of sigma E activity